MDVHLFNILSLKTTIFKNYMDLIDTHVSSFSVSLTRQMHLKTNENAIWKLQLNSHNYIALEFYSGEFITMDYEGFFHFFYLLTCKTLSNRGPILNWLC